MEVFGKNHCMAGTQKIHLTAPQSSPSVAAASFSIDSILNYKNKDGNLSLRSKTPVSVPDETRKLYSQCCVPSYPGLSMWHPYTQGLQPQENAKKTNGLQQESTSGRERRKSKDPAKKRKRTAFTTNQVKDLESEFLRSKYLTISRRMELSTSLQLSETQIKIWFQNRRTKWKRKIASEMELAARCNPGCSYPPPPGIHHCNQYCYTNNSTFSHSYCQAAGYSATPCVPPSCPFPPLVRHPNPPMFVSHSFHYK